MVFCCGSFELLYTDTSFIILVYPGILIFNKLSKIKIIKKFPLLVSVATIGQSAGKKRNNMDKQYPTLSIVEPDPCWIYGASADIKKKLILIYQLIICVCM